MQTYIVVLAVLAMAMILLTFLVAFFHPGLPYRTVAARMPRIDSPEFTRLVALLSDSEAHRDTRVEVLTNGQIFYEAELAAIRSATSHICLEAYIFQTGEVASRFIEAL